MITYCVHIVYTFMQCAYMLHTYEYAMLYIVFIHLQEYIGMYVLATYIHFDTLMYIFSCNMYAHCKQHVFTLYTREFIMFLQCAYQLQIRCIYSVYTITGTYVYTHTYMHTCKVNTHLLAICLHAHIHSTLTDLPYMVRFSSTNSVGP